MSEFSHLNSAACGSLCEEKGAAQEPYSRRGAEETLKGDFKNKECGEVLFPPIQEVAPVWNNGDRCGVDSADEQESGRAVTALDVACDYIKRGWNPTPVPH